LDVICGVWCAVSGWVRVYSVGERFVAGDDICGYCLAFESDDGRIAKVALVSIALERINRRGDWLLFALCVDSACETNLSSVYRNAVFADNGATPRARVST
jgi:hypothetical protein